MRAFQFWILIFISLAISGMMVKQIFLTRQLNAAQRTLVDDQEVISQGSYYENAWQKLALSLFQAGEQDPAVQALLKNDNVGIRSKPDATPASAPSGATPVPAASTKPGPAPAHPATP